MTAPLAPLSSCTGSEHITYRTGVCPFFPVGIQTKTFPQAGLTWDSPSGLLSPHPRCSLPRQPAPICLVSGRAVPPSLSELRKLTCHSPAGSTAGSVPAYYIPPHAVWFPPHICSLFAIQLQRSLWLSDALPSLSASLLISPGAHLLPHSWSHLIHIAMAATEPLKG